MRHLKLHASAALYYHPNFTMVVYPANDEAWRFLPSNKKPSDSNVKLRFFIHEPVTQPVSPAEPIVSFDQNAKAEPPVIMLFRKVLGMPPEGFFTWRDGRTGPEPIKRNIFLMIPPRYADEVALLMKFFTASGANVYTVGSWAKFSGFSTRTSGVILVSNPSPLEAANHREKTRLADCP